MTRGDRAQVLIIVRSPLVTSYLVGINWVVLINLDLLLPLAFWSDLLAWEVWIWVAVAVTVIARAMLIEVRVTSKGVTLRNMFRTYRFGWHEVVGFERGRDIYTLGRPFGDLLCLRVMNGRVPKALGTLSLRESRLDAVERDLSKHMRVHRRTTSAFRAR